MEKPIGYKFFVHLWSLDCPILISAKRDSDFCDTCTVLKDQLLLWTSRDSASSVRKALNIRREKAGIEFKTYKTMASMEKAADGSLIRHYAFDFSEIIRLPQSVLLQLGNEMYSAARRK